MTERKKKPAESKKPAKAGDIGTLVGGVNSLIAHLKARSWMEALQDVQVIWTEAMLGAKIPAMAKLEGVKGDDLASDDNIACLCACLDETCDDMEECGDDEEAVAKVARAAKAEPAKLGGTWLTILGPLLAKALEAILAGLFKEKPAAEARA